MSCDYYVGERRAVLFSPAGLPLLSTLSGLPLTSRSPLPTLPPSSSRLLPSLSLTPPPHHHFPHPPSSTPTHPTYTRLASNPRSFHHSLLIYHAHVFFTRKIHVLFDLHSLHFLANVTKGGKIHLPEKSYYVNLIIKCTYPALPPSFLNWDRRHRSLFFVSIPAACSCHHQFFFSFPTCIVIIER